MNSRSVQKWENLPRSTKSQSKYQCGANANWVQNAIASICRWISIRLWRGKGMLGFLAAGDSVEDVLEKYPKLSRADVQVCLD